MSEFGKISLVLYVISLLERQQCLRNVSMLELQWSRLELSSRWHCEMSLAWPCIVAGRNKEPVGVCWPGKVHWPSLIWAALMPASFCGLPQNKRCNVISLAFSSVKTLIFICLHFMFFLPYRIKALPTAFHAGGVTVNSSQGSSVQAFEVDCPQTQQYILFQFALFSPMLLMLPFPIYVEQLMF